MATVVSHVEDFGIDGEPLAVTGSYSTGWLEMGLD